MADNWIELQAPDGTWVEFNISGQTPTQDELRRFNDLLAKNYPKPEVSPTPEGMPTGDAPQSLGAPPQDAALDFLVPDRSQDSMAPRTSPEAPYEPASDMGLTERQKATVSTPAGEPDPLVGMAPDVMTTAPTQSNPPMVGAEPEGLPVENMDEAIRATNASSLAEPATADAAPTADTANPPQPPRDLPAPTWDMYDAIDELGGSDMEKRVLADRLYREYLNHPETTTDALGFATYRGNRIPRPSGLLFGGVGVSLDDKIGSSIFKGVENVIQFGALGADLAREAISGEDMTADDSWAVWMERNLGQNDSGEDWYNNLIQLGGELAAGGGVGGAAVKIGSRTIGRSIIGRMVANIEAVSPITAKALTAIPKTFAWEAALLSGTDDRSGTLFLGDDAMFKAFQDMQMVASLNSDPEDDEFEQMFNRRRAMLAEAVAVAAPAAAAVEGIAWTGRVLWSFTPGAWLGGFKQSAREEYVVRNVLNELAGVGRSTQGDRAIQERIVNIIKENQDVFLQMDSNLLETMEFQTTTMDALRRGIEEGADQEQLRQLLVRAQGMQRSAVQGPYGQTQEVLNTIPRAFDDQTAAARDTLEGGGRSNMAARYIQDQGQAEIDAAAGTLQNAEAALAAQREAIARAIREDPLFGDSLQRLANRTGMDPTVIARGNADEIVSAVTTGLDALRVERKGFYDMVTQGGGDLDTELLMDALQDLTPADFEIAATAMPRGALQNMMMALRSSADDAAEEGADDLAEAFLEGLSDAGINDYGSLFGSVRADVAVAADRIFRNPMASPAERAAAIRMRQFVDFIDGDLLDAAGGGSMGLRQAVEDAKAFDRQIYFPTVKGGAIGEIDRLSVAADDITFADQARGIVTSAFSNDRASAMSHLVDFLDDPRTGAIGQEDAVNYVLAKVLEPIANRFDVAGEVSPEILQEALSDLRSYGALLDKTGAGPRIRAIEDGLRSATNPRQALEEAVTSASRNLEATQTRIFNNEMREFFTSQGIPYEDGMRIFDEVFRDMATGKNSGRVQAFTDRIYASGNPFLIDGLKASMVQSLRRNFLTTATDDQMVRNVSLARITNENVDGVLQWLDTARIVFRDDPAFVDGIQTFLRESSDVARSKIASPIAVGSATDANRRQSEALDRLITMSVGPLNRLGARLRAAGKGITNAVATDKAEYDRLFDQFMADPQYFTEVAERIFRQDNAVPFETRVNQTVMFMYRSGMLRGDDGDMELDPVQVAELEMNVRNILREWQSRGNSLADEMTGAFGVSP